MNCLIEMWLELRLVVVNLLLVIGVVSYCVTMFLFSMYARDAFDDLKRTMLRQDRLFGSTRDASKRFWKDSKVRKIARVSAILMLIGMLCFIGAAICQKSIGCS